MEVKYRFYICVPLGKKLTKNLGLDLQIFLGKFLLKKLVGCLSRMTLKYLAIHNIVKF